MYVYNFQLTMQNPLKQPPAKHEANKMENIRNTKYIIFIF